MTMNLVGAFKGLSLSSSSSSSFFRGDFGMVTSRNRVSVLFPLESPLSTIESPDKKGVGSTKNVRYSNGKRLGVGIYGDQLAKPGAIISCQHGDEVETLLERMKWDRKGLAVAIAQNVDTGAILMQGFSNREALAATISSRKATFYSRSRSSLWTKGETSMNFIDVHDIYLDCDRDSMIYLGKPHGPTCHTGSETCYFSSVYDNLKHHEVETLLDSVKWDDKGLAVAIAQNVDTGAILMQGFANRGALAATISSRKATFYSRSRSSLWTKGETSMNFIDVHDIFLDCDRDSIIYVGKPHGPTCHTGSETCYYSSVNNILKHPEVEENRLLMTTLYSLESTISQRKAEIGATGKPSWTQKLLVKQDLLCSKIREEADELCRTLEENEDKSRTASEMADVLYHTMVLLAVKDVKIEDVLQVLRERFSQSGIEEKEHRKSQDQN